MLRRSKASGSRLPYGKSIRSSVCAPRVADGTNKNGLPGQTGWNSFKTLQAGLFRRHFGNPAFAVGAPNLLFGSSVSRV